MPDTSGRGAPGRRVDRLAVEPPDGSGVSFGGRVLRNGSGSVVRFSAKCEYGVRAAVELGLRYGEGYVRSAEIADTQRIPEPFLVQILAMLSRSGLVRSLRGPHGGYSLIVRPSSITLADIVHLFEGGAGAHTDYPGEAGCCSASAFHKATEDDSVLRETLREIEASIDRILSATTLDDLCDKARILRDSTMYHI